MMRGSEYVPSEEEIIEAEKHLTREDREQSIEREIDQRKFEKKTMEGFTRLSYLSGNDPEQFKSEFYKIVLGMARADAGRYRVSHPYFLMRELFGGDIAGINVAEVGACNNGGDETWPSKKAFELFGANYFGTDIDVDEETKVTNNGQVVETAQVDALNPEEKIKGRMFELVYSQGFLGHPTSEIADIRGTSVSNVENNFLSAWSDHIRPGGFFVAGTRNEAIFIDSETLEKLGYDYFMINPNLMQNNDYIVARKKRAGTIKVIFVAPDNNIVRYKYVTIVSFFEGIKIYF